MLAADVLLIEPVFASAGDPFYLVAHPCCAAITLVTAVAISAEIKLYLGKSQTVPRLHQG